MENITFNRILSQILEDEELNLSEYFKELFNLGVDITYPCLYSYYCGYTVPGFSKAKKILKASRVVYSNDELEQILEYSKKISSENNLEDPKIMTLTLKIKPELVSNNLTPSTLKNIMNLRANELFNKEGSTIDFQSDKKGKLSTYIAYLVKKDLEENNLIEREEK